MNIFLKDEKRNILVILPVPPIEKKINASYDNRKFEATTGNIKLLGNKNLSSFSISSFFPSIPNKYKFDKSNQYTAKEYVEIIETCASEKRAIRVIIDSSFDFNMLMSIEKFDYGFKDGTGDIYYTLQLEEYRVPNLEQKKV